MNRLSLALLAAVIPLGVVAQDRDASRKVSAGEKTTLPATGQKTESPDEIFGLDSDDFIFDEDQIADDEGMMQSVGTIQGATDDIFYQTANYNFSVLYYRMRGLESNWQTVYVNGINFNDPLRGQFSFSGLGGMTSSAFRSKETEIGMAAAPYAFGSIGGTQNYTTLASQYAPGF